MLCSALQGSLKPFFTQNLSNQLIYNSKKLSQNTLDLKLEAEQCFHINSMSVGRSGSSLLYRNHHTQQKMLKLQWRKWLLLRRGIYNLNMDEMTIFIFLKRQTLVNFIISKNILTWQDRVRLPPKLNCSLSVRTSSCLLLAAFYYDPSSILATWLTWPINTNILKCWWYAFFDTFNFPCHFLQSIFERPLWNTASYFHSFAKPQFFQKKCWVLISKPKSF